jgi:ParB family chromosome partitioning protein
MSPDVLEKASKSPSGSGSLITSVAPGDAEQLIYLDPRNILPNPRQPRRVFSEDALQELADSIRRDGMQEPLIVRRVGDSHQIVCGERRCRAAIMADMEKVPAILRNVPDSDMLKFGLIENIQREDLNAIELAMAYRQLMEEYKFTQERLAEEVGKKRATVANIMRLLQLPDVIQEQVADASLTMGHARALLAVEGTARQIQLARKIIEKGLSVRQAEQLASKETPGSARRKAEGMEKPPHIVQLEDTLRRRLGAKVSVKPADEKRGRIEIEYYSLDDLDRLLSMLTC